MPGAFSLEPITTAIDRVNRSRLRIDRRLKIGLALGGGFARGITHVGVLRALEKLGIPIHAIAGVSAGSIAAALYASGLSTDEIEQVARRMKFSDVARWTISRSGLVESQRMTTFLSRLLKRRSFEEMRIPLAVVATDLLSGKPVVFRDAGDVVLPIRSSCAYPGLFTPIRYNGYCLVDGMVSMEVPARPLRDMGCTHVIAVWLPDSKVCADPGNLFGVISRSFQVLCSRTQSDWRKWSTVVISPDVAKCSWDSFGECDNLVAAGERAVTEALPLIRRWHPAPIAVAS
jgi:NTE family protein